MMTVHYYLDAYKGFGACKLPAWADSPRSFLLLIPSSCESIQSYEEKNGLGAKLLINQHHVFWSDHYSCENLIISRL